MSDTPPQPHSPTTGSSPDVDELLRRATDQIAQLRQQVADLTDRDHEPIAVVGIGCRLAGDIDGPEEFWRFLAEGRSAHGEVPDRWDHERIYDEDADTAGRIYTRHGHFLSSVDGFDPLFFGVSPREAAIMDPQQRVLLECTWEALEHAGIVPEELQGSNTGVYVGACFNDYQSRSTRLAQPEECDVYTATGTAPSVLSGRISYLMGFNGPAMTLDTACSSSLLAAHHACRALRKGDTDLAVVGGANLILDPVAMLGLARARMLAPDGRCKTFDASADGYGRGEGVATIVLKRLSDATAAGDRVLATLAGSATNQDGASKGLTVPSGEAQADVIRAALADARIPVEDVSYVEAHGTGTPVGDPIEIEAIGSVFTEALLEDRRLLVGSVKTNVGHLEASSGITGLIKTVLAIHHGQIPAHIGLERLTPHIPWDELPIDVPTTLTEWVPPSGRMVAGVNSFGFSGSNVHVIVAEPPDTDTDTDTDTSPQAPDPERSARFVLPLSAKSNQALRDSATRHLAVLDNDECDPAMMASTAQRRRTHFTERLAVAGRDRTELGDRLRQWLETGSGPGVATGVASADPALAFLFTGQGAQYPGMGAGLYAEQPVFRDAIDRCTELLRDELDIALTELLFARPDADDGRIDQTRYTQPALFAIEYALARLWSAHGVEPSIVAGHSVGEYAAACVAGVFDLEDAAKLIAARGRLMGGLPAGGTMAAVRADVAAVEPHLKGYEDVASIAAVNGPTSTVVSGAAEAVAEVSARLAEDGISVTPLTVSHAFHSPLMDPILDEFAAVAATVDFRRPHLYLLSNLTGKPAGPEIAGPGYWVDHIRNPVLFGHGIERLADDGYRHFVEIGPQPTLLGLARTGLAARDLVMVPSMRSTPEGAPDGENHDADTFLTAVGALHTAGVDIDWDGLGPDAGHGSTPTYPFQRDRYWLDYDEDADGVTGPWEGPMLGPRLDTPLASGGVHLTPLSVTAPPHLDDHRIFDAPLVPAAGLIEMALEAARGRVDDGPVRVGGLTVTEALVLPEEGSRPTQVVVGERSGSPTVEIHSRADDGWHSHFSASLGNAPIGTPIDLAAIRDRLPVTIEGDEIYERLDELGYNYGPAYRPMTEFRHDGNEILVHLRVPTDRTDSARAHQMDPVLLDGVLQPVGLWLAMQPGHDPDSAFLPVYAESLDLHRPGATEAWAHITINDLGDEVVVADIEVVTGDGEPIAAVHRFTGKRARRSVVRRMLGANHRSWLYRIEQSPAPLEATGLDDGRWLLIGDLDDLDDLDDSGAALIDGIAKAGGEGIVVGPELDLEEPAGLDRWLATDPAMGEPVAGIVLVLGPTEDESSIERHTRRAFHLVQGLATGGRTRLWPDGDPRVLVVTGGAGPDRWRPFASAASPTAEAVLGLARTATMEHPELGVRCVDIGPGVDPAAAIVSELAGPAGHTQVTWTTEGRSVTRLLPASPELDLPDGDRFRLAIPKRGTLDNLAIESIEAADPGPGEVQIRVRAGGINFRDLLNVLDMYPGDPGELGAECAGVVVAVGDGVTGVSVGDEVMTIAGGTFRSHVIVPEKLVFAKPSNMSFAQAATIPITFLTAYYGLHHLAGMTAEDRVLIHAATGGVGMAAVQLAKRAGADVFGTAGADIKQRTAARLGVDHVLHSRTLDFAADIDRLTGGKGVNIVLNSLADDFIPTSLGTLADDGRFLEIGKRGVWTAEQVAELNPTLRYWIYDLLDVIENEPELTAAMMADLLRAFEADELQPLPFEAWPIQRATSALRFMSQARHMGKLVLTVPEPGIRPDATYLVTGATGGLGRGLIDWLAEAGATRIVGSSRSGPSDDDSAWLAGLADAGTEVELVAADVARADDLDRLFAAIDADDRPLGGLFHAAGVLDDGAILNQSWDRFTTVAGPKVDGGWALHQRTLGRDLDHFVLFSSISGLIGNPGQSNYAAANAWLDGLAAHRAEQGLAALSINWGPWADVGMAAETPAAALEATGLRSMRPADGFEAMADAMAFGVERLAVADVDWTRLGRRVEHLAFYEQVLANRAAGQSRGGSGAGDPDFLPRLLETPMRERHRVLLDFVGSQLGRVLGLPADHRLDPEVGLFDLGMDSLTAVEFGNILEETFDQSFPPTLAFESPTISAMVTSVLELVVPADADGATDDDEPVGDDTDSPSAVEEEVAAMSDDEALESLLAEVGRNDQATEGDR